MSNIQFFIAGIPIQKPQKEGARRFLKGGKMGVMTRDSHVKGWAEWKVRSIAAARSAMSKREIIPPNIPVRLTLVFVLPKPSTNKMLYPAVKPDLSNYFYGMENILKGICYYDDNQVVSFYSLKMWQHDGIVGDYDPSKAGCNVRIEVLHKTNRR